MKIEPGTRVTVKTEPEIMLTLDERGELDGLPFIAEMRRFCGQDLEVAAVVDKLVVEGTGFRKMRDVVLLRDARCDGAAHDDCERQCLLLFKTQWLAGFGFKEQAEASVSMLPLLKEGVRGRCHGQAEVLLRASQPLSRLESLWLFLRRAARAVIRRGKFIPTRLARMSTTPTTAKGCAFEVGDEVCVKPARAIRLDAHGGDRGLHFHPLQWSYCGGRFKVMAPVTRIIDERTGTPQTIKDTVILEDVTCNHAFCPRQCYWMWRTSWLQHRVSESEGDGAHGA